MSYFYKALTRDFNSVKLVKSLSNKRKEKSKLDKELSDEQIERILEYRHEKIPEKVDELKELVKAYPVLSVATVFALGLLLGIAFSEKK